MIRKFWITAAAALTLGAAPGLAMAQQYGPPSSGSSSSILFVPGTLQLVSGLNGQGFGGDGVLANSSTVLFDFPSGLAYDPNGSLYIADSGNYIVRKIHHDTGNISTFAGTEGMEGFSANGGVALGAQFGTLSGLIVDSGSNIYVADITNGVVWKITNAGAIAIFAGGGSSPASCSGSTNSIGDGCLATDATLSAPTGLAFDAAGNLYIADSHSFLVREVNITTGKISTFAGNVGDSYFSGCPTALYTTPTGPWTPTQAHLCFPYGIGFDSSGNAYIAESQRFLVRVVTKSTGDISTFAGGGSGSCAAEPTSTNGDGCPASDAILHYPQGLYVDPADRVYFVDSEGDSIRMVDTSGTISTVLGNNGELVKGSIGEPDTEEVLVNGNLVGSANGIDFFTMDPDGNIIASDADSAVITSAGSSGGYVFPETNIYTTSTTTSAHAFSSYFPPYILIGNPSGVPLNLDADPVITGPFGIVSGAGAGTCTFPGTVAPGESCTLVASFTPTVGNNTESTGTIAIASNVGNSPNIINLSGLGAGVPTLSATLLPNPVPNFTSPAQVTSAPQTVTLANTGEVPLNIGTVQFDGNSPTYFAVASTTCPSGATTLDVGKSCTYNITFTPSAATTYNAGFQVQITTQSYGFLSTYLSGTGTPAPTPAATPVISPAAGTYNGPVAVQITDASTNPTIYDTTDGSTPTTSLTPYSGPFTVTKPVTQVQAIATGSANSASATASSTFTIQPYLSFNSALVGIAPGSAQQLTATFSLMGATVPTAALHYGHDYTVGAVSCTPNAAIEVCTVPVAFTPTLPGPRKDALMLSSGGTPLATVMLGGVGQSPFSLVQPGVVTNPVTNSANYLYNSIVDENGTVYIAAQGASAVYSVTKAGVETTLPITGLVSPTAIAVDGAGTLYIAQNTYSKVLVTYHPGTGVQGTVSVIPPAPYLPCANSNGGTLEYLPGVAVDQVGDIFALETLCQQIFELKPDGTYVTTAINPAITQPGNLAVDGAGNVFVGGYTINEIPAAGLQTEINTTGASEGLAVDAADTLYATRYATGNYEVAELAAAAYSTPLAGLDGGTSGEIVDPLGLSLGSDGTLYAGDYGNFDKVDRSQGAIAFGEQQINVASSAHTVGIYNGGNQNLTLASFAASGTGFALQAAASSPCSKGLVIQPGQLCNVAVTLTPPHAGNFSGSVTFTDNSLNTASATQTVALSGFAYGIYVTASPDPLNFADQVAGTLSGAQTVTLTNNGLLYNASIGTPVPSDNAYTATLGTCTSSIAPGGTCKLSVTFDPPLAQAYDDTISLSASSSGGGPNQPVAFGVNGTGTPAAAPIASLSPNPIAFTNQIVGTTSQSIAVMLSNTGNAPLSNINATLSGADPGDFAISTNGTNSCASSLGASSTCFFYVTFTPASAVGFSATLMVADDASGSPQTIPITGTGISFVSNVGTPTATQAVTVDVITAGTLNTIQVLTQGAPNLDFTMTAGGTCNTDHAYNIGDTCTVNVIFTPAFAGARTGAVLLTDSSNNVLGTTYLPGTGIGPQVVFNPGVQSTLPAPASSYNQPLDIVADASENLYLTDSQNNRIVKLPWTGAGYGTPVIVPTSGLSRPDGIAVDGSGNLWISDTGNRRVVEVAWTGSSYATQTVPVNSGLFGPEGIVVDGNGNVFFIDVDRVYELPWTAAGYGAVSSSLTNGLSTPIGLAVDANENLYVADSENDAVYELPWTGSSFGSLITIASGLQSPQGVAVDGGGNVYIANTGAATVLEVPWNGTAFGAQQTVAFNNLDFPTGVAVDGSGNLYLADNGNSDALKLDVSDAPALTFAATNVGSTSSDSPKTVTATNIGNADLTLTSSQEEGQPIPAQGGGGNPSYPANFPENSADNNLCAVNTPVPQGTSCDVSVNFTPTTGGTLSGFVVIADNNLNLGSATQSIPVSGMGIGGPVATPQISPATGTYFTNQSVTITDSTAGATICYTTDNSTPTGSSGECTHGTAYAAAISVSQTGTTIQAMGTLGGLTNSHVASATYTLQTVAPTLTPPGGTYIGAQAVTLATTTVGAEIYYTTNGSTPTGSAPSILYGGTSVAIKTSGTVLNAIAVNSGYLNSKVSTGTYILDFPSAALTSPVTFPGTTVGVTAAALSATLSNNGNAPLTGIKASIAGANPSDFALATGANACGSSLAAGASCLVYITFTPASASSFTATLSIADNAAGSPQTATLTGKGIAAAAPIASLSPTTLAFPNTLQGTTATAMSTTLSNTGNAPLTGITISLTGADPSDFALATGTNACGASLAAGASCSIYVTFTPASANSFTATLSVADNAAGSPQTAALTGTGTPPPGFTVSASPGAQTIAPGGAAVYTVTVQSTNGSFGNEVSLTATGLPPGATASFAPAEVSPGSSSAPSKLTVQTAAATAAVRKGGGWPLAAPVLAFLVLLPFRRWRRVFQGKLVLLVAGLASLGLLATLAGCGGGFALINPQTYTVTVTGTSGSVTHSTTVQLTVQ